MLTYDNLYTDNVLMYTLQKYAFALMQSTSHVYIVHIVTYMSFGYMVECVCSKLEKFKFNIHHSLHMECIKYSYLHHIYYTC